MPTLESFPVKIKKSGHYTICRSFKVNGTGKPLIRIKADNVVLDFQGYSLTNSGKPATVAISSTGYNNLQIMNGTLVNFGVAIQISEGSTIGVYKMAFMNNGAALSLKFATTVIVSEAIIQGGNNDPQVVLDQVKNGWFLKIHSVNVPFLFNLISGINIEISEFHIIGQTQVFQIAEATNGKIHDGMIYNANLTSPVIQLGYPESVSQSINNVSVYNVILSAASPSVQTAVVVINAGMAVILHDNHITLNSAVGGSVIGVVSYSALVDVVIEHNQITTSGANGIVLTTPLAGPPGVPFNNVVISDNVVSLSGADVVGVEVANVNTTTPPGLANTTLIGDNVIVGSIGSGDANQVGVEIQNSSGVQVVKNFLSSLEVGLSINASTTYAASLQNVLANNATGLLNAAPTSTAHNAGDATNTAYNNSSNAPGNSLSPVESV